MTDETADPAHARHQRAVIATATGSTSLLMNVWFPFLPLYMLQVGAANEASALLWVAIGASAQGAGRLIGGPLGAAMFATVSLKAGFATVGGVMLALAGLVALAVREPPVEK